MKKRRMIVFACLTLIAALIMAVPGSARAVKETVAEKSAFCGVIDPGVERLVQGKIWQIRGRVYEKRIEPLLSLGGQPDTGGWNTVVVNLNLNLETGTGSSWGTWVRVYDNSPGTYEGSFAGGFHDGAWYGRITGKGAGVFEGWHVKAFQQDIPDPAALPEGGDPCPGGALPGTPGGILIGYAFQTQSD